MSSKNISVSLWSVLTAFHTIYRVGPGSFDEWVPLSSVSISVSIKLSDSLCLAISVLSKVPSWLCFYHRPLFITFESSFDKNLTARTIFLIPFYNFHFNLFCDKYHKTFYNCKFILYKNELLYFTKLMG
jgi:hypothetical protein